MIPLVACRVWKLTGRGAACSFSASVRGARVHVRRKAAESIEALVDRGLRELGRRVREGMPVARPEAAAVRRLRATPSASRFCN
jgi:hypothetical protein